MAKRTRRQKLIDKLDGKARVRTRQRDGNCCQFCGSFREDNEVHHVIPRGNLILRWAEDNLIMLCKLKCHVWVGANPKLAKEKFAKLFPDRWAEIAPLEKESFRIRNEALEELLEQYD